MSGILDLTSSALGELPTGGGGTAGEFTPLYRYTNTSTNNTVTITTRPVIQTHTQQQHASAASTLTRMQSLLQLPPRVTSPPSTRLTPASSYVPTHTATPIRRNEYQHLQNNSLLISPSPAPSPSHPSSKNAYSNYSLASTPLRTPTIPSSSASSSHVGALDSILHHRNNPIITHNQRTTTQIVAYDSDDGEDDDDEIASSSDDDTPPSPGTPIEWRSAYTSAVPKTAAPSSAVKPRATTFSPLKPATPQRVTSSSAVSEEKEPTLVSPVRRVLHRKDLPLSASSSDDDDDPSVTDGGLSFHSPLPSSRVSGRSTDVKVATQPINARALLQSAPTIASPAIGLTLLPIQSSIKPIQLPQHPHRPQTAPTDRPLDRANLFHTRPLTIPMIQTLAAGQSTKPGINISTVTSPGPGPTSPILTSPTPAYATPATPATPQAASPQVPPRQQYEKHAALPMKGINTPIITTTAVIKSDSPSPRPEVSLPAAAVDVTASASSPSPSPSPLPSSSSPPLSTPDPRSPAEIASPVQDGDVLWSPNDARQERDAPVEITNLRTTITPPLESSTSPIASTSPPPSLSPPPSSSSVASASSSSSSVPPTSVSPPIPLDPTPLPPSPAPKSSADSTLRVDDHAHRKKASRPGSNSSISPPAYKRVSSSSSIPILDRAGSSFSSTRPNALRQTSASIERQQTSPHMGPESPVHAPYGGGVGSHGGRQPSIDSTNGVNSERPSFVNKRGPNLSPLSVGTNGGVDRKPSSLSLGGAPSVDRRASLLNGLGGVSNGGSTTNLPLGPRLAHSILTQLDQLLLTSLPSEAFEQIETLKASMQNVQGMILAKENELVEIGNDVEVLSGILRTQSSFDERSVDAYRAESRLFRHELYTYLSWSCPEYYSSAPIPSNITITMIGIRLPLEHFPIVGAGGGGGGGGKKCMKFDFEVELHELVDQLMRRAYAAYNELLPPNAKHPINPSIDPIAGSLASTLVCKVVGFNDFLLPHHRVFDYEFIRQSVRDSTPIELMIVPKSEDLKPGCSEKVLSGTIWPQLAAFKAEYEAKIKTEMIPLDRNRYTDTSVSFQSRLYSNSCLPSPHMALKTGLDYIPLSELNQVPFRVRILGLDRFGVRTAPRLTNSSVFGMNVTPASDSVDIFVRVYLIHGMTRLNHGPASQTHTIRYDSSAPRFANMSATSWTNQQWILPPPANLHTPHIPYSRLPRETRVLFLVYGSPASSASSQISAAAAAQVGAANATAANAAKDLEAHEALVRNAGALSARSIAARQAATQALQAAADKSAQQATASASVESTPVIHQVSTNEVLLGWSACQLIDEFGVMVTGKKEMNLWSLFCGKDDKSYNYGSLTGNKENLNQILRNTNKHNVLSIPSNLSPIVADVVKRDHHSPPTPLVSGVTMFASLTVEFEQFALPIVAPIMKRNVQPSHGTTHKSLALNIHPKQLDKMDKKQFAQIMHSDPLYRLTSSDRELIWLTRSHLVYHPSMLPKFLSCVDWTNPPLVSEAHRLLQVWSPPLETVSILELLDSQYQDFNVREYAVNILDTRMSDTELQMYLLQLTQCLKFEPYHSSPLSRFLLRRSLSNPYQIGHHFFWHLKAEIGNLDFQERFTIILEEYLSYAGLHARELRKQNSVVQKLQKIAELIVKLKVEEKVSDTEVMKEYHTRLHKLNREFFAKLDGDHDGSGGNGVGGKFQIPLNPKLEAKGLIVSKCKFMSSKKVPLWLVFENADENGPPIYIIFKSGDDLRQDILTLQLLKVMDKIWLDNGLDCRLKPYKCIATGVNDANEGVGMIEVVMGSDTTSGIQLKYGGGAIGALKLDPIDLYIRAHNPTPQAYERAVDNFIRSCAGYCVATFVLGIGDRHNGNIMVTKEGHLFHIDFGHFLGNFKTKFGFNRERSAFVFTPEMAYVMGGKNYKKSSQFKLFKECCFKGFNALRKHAPILENLFTLMCSAGMPELVDRDDILYLRDMLCLELSDRDAENRFKAEIKNSLDGTWRRLDNLIHNAVHGN